MRTGLTIVLLAAIHAVAHPAAAADSPAATATAWKVERTDRDLLGRSRDDRPGCSADGRGGSTSSGARNRSSTWPSGTPSRRSATGCSPASLDDPARREKLDALIARVSHPALYCYFITDEPERGGLSGVGQAGGVPARARPAASGLHQSLPDVCQQPAARHERRPRHGLPGAPAAVRRDRPPALVSYDHYQFATGGDLDGYFLNPGDDPPGRPGGRRAFLNIVQACSWTPSRRVPRGEEMRYLVYTTLAYGAQEFPTTSTATQGTAAESRWRTERRHRSTMR